MATLKFGVPGTSAGILHPLLTHRFLIHYAASDLNTTQREMLSRQTVNFKTDFKSKLVTIEIEQTLGTDMIEAVQALVSAHNIRLTLCSMDGGPTASAMTEFVGRCTAHNFDLDYAGGSRAARHKIVVSYESMYVKE